MSNDYKAGTLARATVRGTPNVLAFRSGDAQWTSDEAVNSTGFANYVHNDREVTDVRPLVVLDVDTASYAVTALEASSDNGDLYCAKQIRDALPRPPKPPLEPTGLGAVVEDAEGERWVRFSEYDGQSWMRQVPHAPPIYQRYDQINAVRVLSEGVTA